VRALRARLEAAAEHARSLARAARGYDRRVRSRQRANAETVYLIEREQLLDAPLAKVFEFFSAARNLERITPRLLGFEVLTPEPIEMRPGTRIEYRLTLHRVPLRWVTRIVEWQPGVRFVDRQAYGPYRLWHHTHDFIETADGTIVRDTVRYSLPFGVLGALAQELFVRRDLERVFDHRAEQVEILLGADDSLLREPLSRG
jgi:ligand-binding SRPBCC domain-containing protein